MENSQSTFKFDAKKTKGILSAEIEYADAAPLMEAYKTHAARLYVDNGAGPVVLKGLRFQKEHIMDLFRAGVTDLQLFFAVAPGNAQYLTVIAGGVIDPAKTGGELNKDILYDFCEPCPNKCANNV